MQRHATEQLNVEMAHLQRSLAGFADDGKRLGQHDFDVFAVGDALLEYRGLGFKLRVGKVCQPGLEGIDLADHLRVLLEQPLIAAAENLGEDIGDHRTCN